MDNKALTLSELEKKAPVAANRQALVGLDGFVDLICAAVDKRHGQATDFEAIPTIAEFGARISAAAGKSTNIELFPRMQKLGGNGPIMANALLATGMAVKYVGALGQPDIHPVFADFARRSKAISIGAPGVTHAVEFTDGKIMLGNTSSLDQITYEHIVKVMGEGAFFDALNRADLLAFVNWTMIPNMTGLLASILDLALPNFGPRENGRLFFFDLADPEKRSAGDLLTLLNLLTRFRSHGAVTLGLNLKEAQQVASVLGLPAGEPTPAYLKNLAQLIRQKLELTTVVIHPTSGAAAATSTEAAWVDGPYCEKPLITTGAGDHFNAGFTTGQVLNLSLTACLTLAVSTSGSYVRTAKSPSLGELATFLRNWK